MSALSDRLEANAKAVSEHLDELLPEAGGPRGKVVSAMRYAALSGGKRLRPFLVMETAALFGVTRESALGTAAAVEMIHCYSLVHDDLPAMDDSDLRRGRPTVHKEFDEATAILAGDGLLTEAFRVLARPDCHEDAQVRAELIDKLAAAAGVDGMVGGQMIDISPERGALDLEGITELQALKTGALITFSCEAGAILGRADSRARSHVVAYAKAIGLAFQIADDLLDALATPEDLGKPTGQDAILGKATFIGQLGLDGARAKADELVSQAEANLELFGEKADLLRDVARFIVARKS